MISKEDEKKLDGLERIAAQALCGLLAYHNPSDPNCFRHDDAHVHAIVKQSVLYAKELIRQIDGA